MTRRMHLLDASALLAVLFAEPGSDVVERSIDDRPDWQLLRGRQVVDSSIRHGVEKGCQSSLSPFFRCVLEHEGVEMMMERPGH